MPSLINSSRISMAALLLAAGVAGAVASAVRATTTTWTGRGDGTTFGQAANWSGGAPSYSDGASIISTDGAVVVEGSGGYTSHGLLVGDVGSLGSTLNITGGSLTMAYDVMQVGDINNFGVSSLAGSKGTVNQTGGTVNIGSTQYPRVLQLAAAASGNLGSAAYGVYNFGGTSASTAPVINVTSAITIGQRGNEVGLFSASGYGTLNANQLVLSNYGGDGTFSVSGGHESIAIGVGGNSTSNSMILSRYGTPVVDYTLGAGGASTINVTGNVEFSSTANAVNNTVFNLALAPNFQAKVGDTFTIINATGLFTGFGQFGDLGNGQTLAVGNYTFQANYTNPSGGGSQLSLQVVSAPAVPEPASIGIFGAGVLGLLLLKKRRESRYSRR